MSARHHVSLVVNGEARELDIEACRTLAEVVREDLGLTGTHVGCEHGVCGACTVAIDGEPARSCLVLGVQAAGTHVETVESLAVGPPEGEAAGLGPLQRAMWDENAFQCAFCAPGFLMTLECIIRSGARPTGEALRDELSGNLCRCTGYQSILAGAEAAIREAGATSDA